ncbi:CheR family methyltransferase [Tabrizicola aquatica]|uniref:CheR family methyltransferase n=1 Tax=Tabrizicola aquatica TaxID=909926 RepID=UPI000CD26A2D|nr:protein-glutamate O-methyltransferase CheR [Tabrizicola aquatica]
MTTLAQLTGALTRLDRELVYTSEDFSRIARFMHDATGIRLTEANERMVYARLANRVQDLGFDSFAAYVDKATTSGDERDRLISCLTTNTTHFYRESYHFDFLAQTVLPELAGRARSGERIRIWSAGCSTGEEAYSIAMCLLQGFPDAASHDVKILATDIDRTVLARAATASYPPGSLREVPKPLLDTCFEPVPGTDHRTPRAHIRAMVTFRPLNLIEPWPFRGQFDAIFCRNVAIYMDAQTQEHIWTGFHRVLRPGGHLFIGHSERLSPALKGSFTIVGNTIHRRNADPASGR